MDTNKRVVIDMGRRKRMKRPDEGVELLVVRCPDCKTPVVNFSVEHGGWCPKCEKKWSSDELEGGDR